MIIHRQPAAFLRRSKPPTNPASSDFADTLAFPPPIPPQFLCLEAATLHLPTPATPACSACSTDIPPIPSCWLPGSPICGVSTRLNRPSRPQLSKRTRPTALARNRSTCGGRSAYSRRTGTSPLCYPSDVTDRILADPETSTHSMTPTAFLRIVIAALGVFIVPATASANTFKDTDSIVFVQLSKNALALHKDINEAMGILGRSQQFDQALCSSELESAIVPRRRDSTR